MCLLVHFGLFRGGEGNLIAHKVTKMDLPDLSLGLSGHARPRHRRRRWVQSARATVRGPSLAAGAARGRGQRMGRSFLQHANLPP